MYLPPFRLDVRYLLNDTEAVTDLIIDPDYFRVFNGTYLSIRNPEGIGFLLNYFIDKKGIYDDYTSQFHSYINTVLTSSHSLPAPITFLNETLPYAEAKQLALNNYRTQLFWFYYLRDRMEASLDDATVRLNAVLSYEARGFGNYDRAINAYTAIKNSLTASLLILNEDIAKTEENVETLQDLTGTGNRTPSQFINELPYNITNGFIPQSYLGKYTTNVTVSTGFVWQYNPFGLRQNLIGISNTFAIRFRLKNYYAITRPYYSEEVDYSTLSAATRERLISSGLLLANEYADASAMTSPLLDPVYQTSKYFSLNTIRQESFFNVGGYSSTSSTEIANRQRANNDTGLLTEPSGSRTKTGLPIIAWRNREDRFDITLEFSGFANTLCLVGTDPYSNLDKKTREYDCIRRSQGITQNDSTNPFSIFEVANYGVTSSNRILLGGRESLGEGTTRIEDENSRNYAFFEQGEVITKHLGQDQILDISNSESELLIKGASPRQPVINGNRITENGAIVRTFDVSSDANGFGRLQGNGGTWAVGRPSGVNEYVLQDHLETGSLSSRGLGARTDGYYRRGWQVSTVDSGFVYEWEGLTYEDGESIPFGPIQGTVGGGGQYQIKSGYLLNTASATITVEEAYSGTVWFGMRNLGEDYPKWIFRVTHRRDFVNYYELRYLLGNYFIREAEGYLEYEDWIVVTGDPHHSQPINSDYALNSYWFPGAKGLNLLEQYGKSTRTTIDGSVVESETGPISNPPLTLEDIKTLMGPWPGSISLSDIPPGLRDPLTFSFDQTFDRNSLVQKYQPIWNNGTSVFYGIYYYLQDPTYNPPKLDLYTVDFTLSPPIT